MRYTMKQIEYDRLIQFVYDSRKGGSEQVENNMTTRLSQIPEDGCTSIVCPGKLHVRGIQHRSPSDYALSTGCTRKQGSKRTRETLKKATKKGRGRKVGK